MSSRWLGSLLLVLAVALTGCGGEEKKAGPTKAERIIGDALGVDLAMPPTRADLGLEEGQDSVTLALPGEKAFEVLVYFDNGETLQTEAQEVTATSATPSSPPNELRIVRSAMDYDAFQQALDDAVRNFGADPQEAERLLGLTPGSDDEASSLFTAQTGAESLSLQATVDAESGEYAVTWQVNWKKAPSATPTPTPTPTPAS